MAEFKRELGRGRTRHHPVKTSKQMWLLKYAEEECDGHVLSFVVCFLSTLALEKIMPSSCCIVWLDDVTSSLKPTLSFALDHFLRIRSSKSRTSRQSHGLKLGMVGTYNTYFLNIKEKVRWLFDHSTTLICKLHKPWYFYNPITSLLNGCASGISYANLCALPTISIHPELDGRTLDIVHCFYNMVRHFSNWKVAFSALIKLQILLTVRVLTKNRMTCILKHIYFYFY